MTEDEFDTIRKQLASARNDVNVLRKEANDYKIEVDRDINGIGRVLNELGKRLNNLEQIIGSQQFKKLLIQVDALEKFRECYEKTLPDLIQQMAYMLATLERLEKTNDSLYIYSTMKAAQTMERVMNRLSHEQKQELLSSLGGLVIPVKNNNLPIEFNNYPPNQFLQATCARDLFDY
jgi:chromosome segregation ATPase